MAWILYLPAIVQAIIEITKFLMEMRDRRSTKEFQEAVSTIRKTGDTRPLFELLERLRSLRTGK